jgi:Flp pilus assembly pilin Flp
MQGAPAPPRWASAVQKAWQKGMRQTRQAGQGLVEYALLLGLIAILVIAGLRVMGTSVSNTFADVNCRLSGGTMHVDNGNGNSTRCDLPNGNG